MGSHSCHVRAVTVVSATFSSNLCWFADCTFWNRRWTVFDFYWESNIFQGSQPVIRGHLLKWFWVMRSLTTNRSMRLMTLILEERKQFICTFKKYFCGTRFTRLPFLKRLKEKHKLGDACVSGKASRFDTVFFFFLSVLIKRYQLSSYFFIQEC